MQKLGKQLIPFSFFLLSAFLIFFFLRQSYFFGTVGILQSVFSPVQKGIYTVLGKEYIPSEEMIAHLAEKNADLITQINTSKVEKGELKALRDQFGGKAGDSKKLLPVRIIGMRRFVPGVSVPDTLTINAGSRNGIKKGMTAIYKNMLVGKVSVVSQNISIIDLPSSQSYSFTGKTLESNALGVVQGAKDGSYVLGNVVLSYTLTVGDQVITKGDIDATGKGFPPDLVIGEITSVSKIPSALFQAAEIKNALDVTKLTDVFVMLSP
jgi:rod shape-determining protein MreC